MRKTVNISIGSSLFVIDEEAYATLDAYLKSIRAHFSKTADADEIVSDIEDRIAEELGEKLSARKKVILLEDVDEVIRRMGTVKDFEAFDEAAGAGEGSERSFKKIRLYRNADDKIIGGVCSGIANYFGIDPMIVRLAFGLSLFLGGFGFILYVLLWIILPEAKTAAEKVEMTGGRVTLSSIQAKIEKTITSEKSKSTFRKIVVFPFAVAGGFLRVVGRVLKFVFPILGRIVGFFVMLWAAAAIAFASFVLLAMLFNPASPYIGFPLREAFGATPYLVMMLSGYLLLLVPLILILLVGACLLLLRNVFSLPPVLGLAAVWFASLVTLGVAGFTAAPQVQAVAERYKAEHFDLVEKPLDLAAFDKIVLRDRVDAKIMQGSERSVVVRASKHYLDSIEATVDGGTLSLARVRAKDTPCIIFCPRAHATVEIVIPRLTELTLDQKSQARVSGFSDDARYLIADHSVIEADVSATSITADLRGHSYLDLSGSGAHLTLLIKDHSRAEVIDFPVTDLQLEMHDHSQARVDARGSIRGRVSNHSYLLYQGAPPIKEVEALNHSQFEPWGDWEGEGW